jgi:hypothetical protein
MGYYASGIENISLAIIRKLLLILTKVIKLAQRILVPITEGELHKENLGYMLRQLLIRPGTATNPKHGLPLKQDQSN